MAPLTSSCALAGELSSGNAGTRSTGSTASTRSSEPQPVDATSASMIIMVRIGSVAEVHGDDHARELWKHVLLPVPITAAPGAAKVGGFGLETAVARPGVQLAAGERHARLSGA